MPVILLGSVLLFVLIDPILLSPTFYLSMSGMLYFMVVLYLCLGLKLSRKIFFMHFIFVAITLFSAFYSGYFWNAFEFSILVSSASLIVTVLASLPRDEFRNYILLLFGTIGLFYFSFTIFGYIRQYELFGLTGLYHFPARNMANPNTSGRILAFSGMIIFTLSDESYVQYLLAMPLFITTILTGSRGAVVALSVSLIVYFGIQLGWEVRRVMFFTLLSLIIIIGTVYLGGLYQITDLQRGKLILESMNIYGDNLISGIGGWNFGLVYPKYSLDGVWQRHPHNLILYFVTAFGSLGTLYLIWITYEILKNFSIHLIHAPLIFILLHELVDTMVWIPGILLLMAIYLGFSLNFQEDQRIHSSYAIITCLILFFANLYVLRGSIQYKIGYLLAEKSNWTPASKQWKNGYTGFMNSHKGISQFKKGHYKRALTFFDKASQINDYDPYYRYLQYRAHKKVGNPLKARIARQRSQRRDPRGMLRIFTDSEKKYSDSLISKIKLESKSYLSPDSYIHFLLQNINRGHLKKARRQVDLLQSFHRQTPQTKIVLAKLKSSIYEEQGKIRKYKNWQKISQNLRIKNKSSRPMFHQFFYRRKGLDHE